MSLLAPARRVYHGWRKVMPLYDGRECPDCGAVVLGREGRRLHREYHLRLEHWQDMAAAAIRTIAKHCGLTIQESDEDSKPGGSEGYDRVDLSVPVYYDQEDEGDEYEY